MNQLMNIDRQLASNLVMTTTSDATSISNTVEGLHWTRWVSIKSYGSALNDLLSIGQSPRESFVIIHFDIHGRIE
jgi:hypothetical protein